MNDTLNVFTIKGSGEQIPLTTKVHFQWDYIAMFVFEISDPKEFPEESERVEIFERQMIPVSGTMDSECYYSECLDRAEASDILDPFFREGQRPPEIDLDKLPPGVYRMVFGVNTRGDKYWTDCGYEYDAWEEYHLISQYKYTDKEAEVCFGGDRDPFGEQQVFQFETDNSG